MCGMRRQLFESESNQVCVFLVLLIVQDEPFDVLQLLLGISKGLSDANSHRAQTAYRLSSLLQTSFENLITNQEWIKLWLS